MGYVRKAILWARYLRHVRPRSIVGRVTHEVAGRMVCRWPSMVRPASTASNAFADPALGRFARVWKAMAWRYADIEGLEQGRFASKGGAAADFGSVEAMDWTPRFRDQPHLANWAYDFAYFCWAPVLVERDACAGAALLARMLRTMESRHALENGRTPHFVWNPIVVAVRMLSLAAAGRLAFEAGIAADDPDLAALARHIAYGSAYLDRFAERYLGYNHAGFALVALTVADVAVLGRAREPALAIETACSFAEQVLPDGLQGERSATYHIHVLLTVQSLLALDALPAPDAKVMRALERSMRDALDVLVHPDGEIALFNDCAQQDSVPPALVGWVPPDGVEPRRALLPCAGYVKLAASNTALIMDAGVMGPADVIGHAHADFLSCELSVGGLRLLTNPGVFAYSAGPLRDRTRCAAAHNGPGYEGLEPAELFGAWRVGRRGRAWFAPDAVLPGLRPLEAIGLCDGYDRFGGRVLRYAGLDEEGREALIFDLWRAGDGLRPALNMLLPEGWAATLETRYRARLAYPDTPEILLETAGFGIRPPEPSEWRPYGAMVPQPALALALRPEAYQDGVMANLIRVAPADAPTAEDGAALVARLKVCCLRLLYSKAPRS